MNYLIYFEIIVISTFWYYYLHKKTRISLKYLFIDNIGVIIPLTIVSFLLLSIDLNKILVAIINFLSIFILSFIYTMIRFWRTPKRKILANENELVSPADGNILYIVKYEKDDIPVSIKKGLKASLFELTETKIIKNGSYWLLGINMTPFDVHKNCAPASGYIVFNKHINGKFFSLKEPEAILRNERNSIVIKTDKNEFIGVIQTASKMVRKIDIYIKVGQYIRKGDWFGMIRFGSQVDVIIPGHYEIDLQVGQQVYAGKTIIAHV